MSISQIDINSLIRLKVPKSISAFRFLIKGLFSLVPKKLTYRQLKILGISTSILAIYLYYKQKNKCRKIYKKTKSNVQILTHLALTISKYKPTFYLPWAITKILYVEIFRGPKFLLDKQYITLDDSGDVAIEWFPENFSQMAVDTPIIIFNLGVCGTSDAPYCQELCSIVLKRKWRMVVVHRRGFGYNNLSNSKFMQKEEDTDLEYVIKKIKEIYQHANLYILGVSAGANFAAKYLGRLGNNTLIKAFCSISNPFNICKVSYNIKTNPRNILYSKLITRNMSKMLLFHCDNPHFINLLQQKAFNFEEFKTQLKNKKNPWEVEKHFIIKFGDHESVYDYHHNISCEYVLNDIKVPSLFINNREDPICSKETIPLDKIYKNDKLILLLVDKGGHIEYLSGNKPEWWAFDMALEYFKYFENCETK